MKKTLAIFAVVALVGIALPVDVELEAGTPVIGVAEACAFGSCAPAPAWDCIIDGWRRTDKCDASDPACIEIITE
ncbi:MAG: hypothetical protein ACE5FK_00425 [Candidatus Methylomirabilia bacterium]